MDLSGLKNNKMFSLPDDVLICSWNHEADKKVNTTSIPYRLRTGERPVFFVGLMVFLFHFYE